MSMRAVDEPTAPGSPPEAETDTLSTRLAGVAKRLERLRKTSQRGPLAELRRLHPQQVPGATFWTLVDRHHVPRGEESFWLSVLPLMVRQPHQHGMKPGVALEAAGISKARFERWLRLDRDGARREARRLLSKLKDQGLDWVQLGNALYRWNDGDRYRLARDFFIARSRREHTSTHGAN